MENNLPRILKRSSDFSILKSKGRRFKPSDWLLVSYLKTNRGYLRYGVTIPKKVGTAVLRNRIKRRVRAYFIQKYKLSSPSLDLNLVFFPAQDDFYKKMSAVVFKEQMQKVSNYLEKTYPKQQIQNKSTRR